MSQLSQRQPRNVVWACLIGLVISVIAAIVYLGSVEGTVPQVAELGMAYFFLGIPLQIVYCIVSMWAFSKGVAGFITLTLISAVCLGLLALTSTGETEWVMAKGLAGITAIYFTLVWLVAFRRTEKTDA